MRSKIYGLIAGAAAVGLFSSAASALTVYSDTSSFINSPTYFNGFEGMGAWAYYSTLYPGPSGYSEGGITVTYVGSPGGIWTTAFPTAQGNYSWYESSGSNGYTDITLTGGGTFSAIQFLASSGWYAGGADLLYQLLLGGVQVATGDAGSLSSYYTGFNGYYGFSGATFDEVRLQGPLSTGPFDPTAYEAGAYDSIAIGSVSATPLPSTWTMLIAGFVGLGFFAYRGSKKNAAALSAA